jgi:hypothetical protein
LVAEVCIAEAFWLPYHALLGDGGHHAGSGIGCAAGVAISATLASLITQSWNQLVDWLKRLETLRECVETGHEDHLSR